MIYASNKAGGIMEEKIDRLKELIKAIDSYNDVTIMRGSVEELDLQMLTDMVLEIVRTL